MKGFEFIKDVHLDPVPFDMERELLTPTFKKKRPQLVKHYQVSISSHSETLEVIVPAKKYSWGYLILQDVIDRMYKNGN